MGKNSKIQWCDDTWNIARGCTKVNKDCKFCYMYRDSLDGTRYEPMEVVKTKTVFDLPLRLKKPSKIFTSSLTDFFHPEIDSYRHEAWDIIRRCPQHSFLILTKRPERIQLCLPYDWGTGYKNVWLGVSCGHQDAYDAMWPILAGIPAVVRFISFEPLLEPIALNFYLPVPDWVIIGGESGNGTKPITEYDKDDKKLPKYGYRVCDMDWIADLVYDLKHYPGRPNTTKVFVKQLGTHLAKQLKLANRHGGDMDEWPSPSFVNVREFPITNN